MTIPQEPPDTTQLEAALASFLADQSDDRAESFRRALGKGFLVVPLPKETVLAQQQAGSSGWVTLEEDTQVGLPVQEWDDRKFVIGFTSVARMNQSGAPADTFYAAIPMSDLIGAWPEGHDLALNPNTPFAIDIKEPGVRAIAGPPTMPQSFRDASSAGETGAPSE